MNVLNTLGDAFKNLKVSGRSNMQDTSEKPSTGSLFNSQSDSKHRELLAFRTIITMLYYIQSSNTRFPKTDITVAAKEELMALRVQDALSAVLIRQHEVAAVVAQPYNGLSLKVFASVVHPSKAEPQALPQHFARSVDQPQNFWDQVRNFTVTINPRAPKSKINNHNDSLINLTSLPIIGDHQDQVPKDLVAVAEVSKSVLDVYLDVHW